MKILLYCPLHPETPKIYGRTLQSILRQGYDPLEIHFSKGDNPQDTGVPLNDGRANILHNYMKARDMVLDWDFDALMTVESDMIIPTDATERLIACDADVAYGLYCFRANNKWSAFVELSKVHGKSISQLPEYAKEKWGQQIETQGVGLGCTLIKRHVLEEIPFRAAPGAANDWFFAMDVSEKGYRQVTDLGLVCGHIHSRPVPRIIWPDPEQPYLYRNDFLETIPVNGKGEIEVEIKELGEFYIPREAVIKPVTGTV